jgi:hypothetical protein
MVVSFVVYPQDDGAIRVFCGGRYEDFLAPAVKCFWAPSRLVNKPVDSTARYTPRSFQGRLAGSRSWRHLSVLPLTTKSLPCTSTVPGSGRVLSHTLAGVRWFLRLLIVYCHKIMLAVFLDGCSVEKSADSSKTINSNIYCHKAYLHWMNL